MVRRVITGFDERGESVFLADGDSKAGIEIWETTATPTTSSFWGEPVGPQPTNPPAGGTRFRVLSIPPLPLELRNIPGDQTGMHATKSVDYIVIMSGEIHLVLDHDAEKLLKAGDVAVLRGVVHAWRNKGSEPCVLAAVLVAAKNEIYPEGRSPS